MKKIMLAAAVIALPLSALALADGVTVVQEGKKFSEPEIVVKRGQTVTFLNKDAVTHNVYSNTPGMAFDLRTQRPNESSDVKFDSVGEAEVHCAIHPQMKMMVKVTD